MSFNTLPHFLVTASLAWLLTALPIHSAHALGLGQIQVRSTIGEPLHAEITLVGGDDTTPSDWSPSKCVRLVMPRTRDELPWLQGAKLSRTANTLIVQTTEPIDHPVMRLALRVGCGAETTREFTLLISPSDSSTPALEATSKPVAPAPNHIAPDSGSPPLARDHRPGKSPRPPKAESPPTTSDHAGRVRPKPGASSRPPETPSGTIAEAGLKQTWTLDETRLQRPADPLRSAHLRWRQALSNALESPPGETGSLTASLALIESAVKSLRADLSAVPTAAAPPVPPAAPTPARPERAQESGTTLIEAPTSAPDWAVSALMLALVALAVVGGATGWWWRRRSSGAPASTPGATRQAADASPATPSITEPEVAAGLDMLPGCSDQPLDTAPFTVTPAAPIAGRTVHAGEPANMFSPEHVAVMELAEIMLSFGRGEGAADALAEYVRTHPRNAIEPWLRLLDLYRQLGKRADFEELGRRIGLAFNISAPDWSPDGEAVGKSGSTVPAPAAIEAYAHVVERLTTLWGTADCAPYLDRLLRDNRDGRRIGFPALVVDEILMLRELAEALAPRREDQVARDQAA